METYFQQLLTQGGPLGAVVVATVLLMGLWLRHKGWLFEPPKTAAPPDLSRMIELSKQVENVRERLTSVEHDLRGLPTREEIHALNVAQIQLNERLLALDRTTTTTGRAVTRIEDYMIQVSRRSQEP